jgi:hypothetical protein
MSTLRASVFTSVVLSMSLASGCNSDSNSGVKDASPDGRRDGARDISYTQPDTTSQVACEIPTSTGTVTVQPNRSVTINCVTWTCKGDGNFTSSGGACSDAGPDLPVNRDVRQDGAASADAAILDAGAAIDGGVKDVQPTEAGKKDTSSVDIVLDGGSGLDSAGPVDLAVDLDPDLPILLDTAAPEPDVAMEPDLAPVEVCISETGQKYYAGGGVCFRCAGNLCVCDANAVIVAATAVDCPAVDAW